MDITTLSAAMAYAKKAAEAAKPTAEELQTAVDNWLDDHPEATTTVQDGAITKAKLDNNLQGKISDVDYTRNKVENLSGEYYTSESIFELGNIAYVSGVITYYDNTKRVRTKQGNSYHLSTGTVVKLSSYDGYRLYVGGSESGSGWLNTNYTIPSEGDYFILLRKEPETTITNISDLVDLLSITSPNNGISGIAEDSIKTVTGTSIISNWVYKYAIKIVNDVAQINTPEAANAYRYLIVNCSAGDTFVINAKISSNALRMWFFIDSQNAVIKVSGLYDDTAVNRVLIAPENAVKLVINDNSQTGICYKGYNTGGTFAKMYTDVANAIGKNCDFIYARRYWAGGITPGESLENGSLGDNRYTMCAIFTLPAKKILRVVGTVNSTDQGIYVWRAYNASTGILQAISKQTAGVVSDYLCFDNDVRMYVNILIDSDYYVGIITEESPFYEIYQNDIRKPSSVMELNGRDNVLYTLKTMRRPVRLQTRPFVLCHFSDIHADPLNTPRIGEFFTETSGLIDAKISTGDMVYQSLDDGMDFWDESNLSDVLLAIGNHECATGTSSVSYDTATPQQVYEAVLADRIGAWSVTQPENAATNYLGYYYKDYATWKIRLIVLDLNHDSAYLTAQLSWLNTILSDAKTNGYNVVCASHYQFISTSNPTILDCSFSLRADAIKAEGVWSIPSSFESAIDDFIDDGGKFICWLGGHSHQDYVLLNSTGKQLCITVTTENFSNSNAWSFGDDYREQYHRSQDAFNIIGIDTYSKQISVFRIGNNLSRLMNSRNHLCIDYAKKTVVWSD